MSDKCKYCGEVNNTLDNTHDNKLDKIIEMLNKLNINKQPVNEPVDLIKLFGLKPVSEYNDDNN